MKENGHIEKYRGHVEVNRKMTKFNFFFPEKSKMMIPSLEEKWN